MKKRYPEKNVRIQCESIDKIKNRLPNHYDALFISFGLRNLTKIPTRLTDMFHILKPNGKLLILDFSQRLENPVLNQLYQFYFNSIVPKIGYLLQRKRHMMYDYLPQSVKFYLLPNELTAHLLTTGFQKVDYYPLLFGQTGIHIAQK